VREWVEWVKHNLPFINRAASAFASSEVQNPQNFPFIFFKIPRARFSEKELENFSVFESSELSGRGSRRIQEINSFFGKRFERGCIFVQKRKTFLLGCLLFF
jgi:hypothetical protein